MKEPVFYALATDKVRFVGDLVAMVVAESRSLAEDACELITVDYDPLPPVATYEAALDPAQPALFDDLGDNVVYRSSSTYGDVDAAFAEADRVVRATFDQHRHANVPMETRGAVADYDPGLGGAHLPRGEPVAPGLRHYLSKLIGQPMERTARAVRRRRRRLRSQGLRAPRGRRSGRGQQAARPTGEMDRGPQRAPAWPPARPGRRPSRSRRRSTTTARCSASGPS